MNAAKGVTLAKIAGKARVSFSHCYYCPWDAGLNGGKTVIHAQGGRLGITDCTFINRLPASSKPAPQIVLEPDVQSAIITANEFYGPGTISNQSQGKVQIANNIERTDSGPRA